MTNNDFSFAGVCYMMEADPRPRPGVECCVDQYVYEPSDIIRWDARSTEVTQFYCIHW